jgi:hypothetical protein
LRYFCKKCGKEHLGSRISTDDTENRNEELGEMNLKKGNTKQIFKMRLIVAAEIIPVV